MKHPIEVLLVRAGLAHFARKLSRRRVLVLTYHNIVPEGASPAGDTPLHLPQRKFAAQLDLLGRTHDVVPLHSLLEPNSLAGKRPRVVITFDDAYRGAVTVGVDELAKRRLPATIFVPPARIGGGAFWWDALRVPGATSSLPEGFRQRALHELRGHDAIIRRWARTAGFPVHAVPDHATSATEEELRQAVRHQGVTLASHTWSHANLVQLGDSELRAELVRPLQWLQARFDAVIPWLSYPYGISSPAVELAAANAGYRAAVRSTGGWVPFRLRNPYSLPRLNVPSGLSLNGFALWAAGLFPRRRGQ